MKKKAEITFFRIPAIPSNYSLPDQQLLQKRRHVDAKYKIIHLNVTLKQFF